MKTLLMTALLVLAGCTAPAEPEAAPCGSPVVTDALPVWARGGFSDDGAGVAHVLGREGDILAVLFGAPLSAPPAPDHGNKILWVSRLPALMGDTLRISATLAATGETAEREVQGGPGPSIIDLPEPGCWRLRLTWNGHNDAMDLTYV
jgi:hypothetical protein